MDAPDPRDELPLFPLNAVLFPDGLLRLTVFEARYLDLISDCRRRGTSFGVVALLSGGEVRQRADDDVRFESVGTRAELIDADSDTPGILQVRCRGTHRFRIDSSRRQADGLQLACALPIDDDPAFAPTQALEASVRGLASTIATLAANAEPPFLEPYRFDDAGWVANRWCEILPISKAARQRLMELPDPLVRLQLVDDFLRSKGVVN